MYRYIYINPQTQHRLSDAQHRCKYRCYCRYRYRNGIEGYPKKLTWWCFANPHFCLLVIWTFIWIGVIDWHFWIWSIYCTWSISWILSINIVLNTSYGCCFVMATNGVSKRFKSVFSSIFRLLLVYISVVTNINSWILENVPFSTIVDPERSILHSKLMHCEIPTCHQLHFHSHLCLQSSHCEVSYSRHNSFCFVVSQLNQHKWL